MRISNRGYTPSSRPDRGRGRSTSSYLPALARRVKKLELVKPQGFMEAVERLVKDHSRAQLSPDELETHVLMRKKCRLQPLCKQNGRQFRLTAFVPATKEACALRDYEIAEHFHAGQWN